MNSKGWFKFETFRRSRRYSNNSEIILKEVKSRKF